MMASPARRILMTTDAVGGVWTYATELVRGLCERGDDSGALNPRLKRPVTRLEFAVLIQCPLRCLPWHLVKETPNYLLHLTSRNFMPQAHAGNSARSLG